jgi:hypothetical protein
MLNMRVTATAGAKIGQNPSKCPHESLTRVPRINISAAVTRNPDLNKPSFTIELIFRRNA